VPERYCKHVNFLIKQCHDYLADVSTVILSDPQKKILYSIFWTSIDTTNFSPVN